MALRKHLRQACGVCGRSPNRLAVHRERAHLSLTGHHRDDDERLRPSQISFRMAPWIIGEGHLRGFDIYDVDGFTPCIHAAQSRPRTDDDHARRIQPRFEPIWDHKRLQCQEMAFLPIFEQVYNLGFTQFQRLVQDQRHHCINGPLREADDPQDVPQGFVPVDCFVKTTRGFRDHGRQFGRTTLWTDRTFQMRDALQFRQHVKLSPDGCKMYSHCRRHDVQGPGDHLIGRATGIGVLDLQLSKAGIGQRRHAQAPHATRVGVALPPVGAPTFLQMLSREYHTRNHRLLDLHAGYRAGYRASISLDRSIGWVQLVKT